MGENAALDPAGWVFTPHAEIDAFWAEHPGREAWAAPAPSLLISGAELLNGNGTTTLRQWAIDEYRRRQAAGLRVDRAPAPSLLIGRLTERVVEHKETIASLRDIITGHDGVVASLREELATLRAEIAQLRAPAIEPPRSDFRDRGRSWWHQMYAPIEPHLGAQPYLPSED